MKQSKSCLLLSAAALSVVLLPAAVNAQAARPAATPASASGTSAQELTRSLNTRPAGAVPMAQPATQATTRPAPQTANPSSTPPAPQPAARPVPSTAQAPAAAPAEAKDEDATVEEAAPPPPPPLRLVPLNAAAIAGLPFSIDLKGAQIVERPAGPGAKIYSVSRAEKPLLMIYTGPQSDYPIYDGEQAVVAGRVSVIVAEGANRRAVEHLFRREDKQPHDIHVWLIASDGAEGALAEQIGQTVDPR